MPLSSICSEIAEPVVIATGCMGLADYLGWNFRSKACIPIVNVHGCPGQPENFV